MIAELDDYLVVPVPFDVGDFYVSGFGYLCARTPARQVLCDTPVTPLGITSDSQIVGYASIQERQRAGLDVSEPFMTALLLKKRH